MTKTDIVRNVVARGRPFVRRVASEGTAESGPHATEHRGWRWGQVEVFVGRRDAYLLMEPRWIDSPYGSGWERPFSAIHDDALVADMRRRLEAES